MFDDLDDPNHPTIPSVDAVMRRGRAWRARRTAMLVGTGAIGLTVATASFAFAFHGNGSQDIRVAADVPDSSSTTEPDTTIATTPTTVAEATTTVARITTPITALVPSTTTTTPATTTTAGLPAASSHLVSDWTALAVTWDTPGTLSVKSGGTATVSYTITNRGTWPVTIPNDPSPDCVVGSFPQPPLGADDAMWPGPVSDNWEWCTPAASLTLAPGQSVHYVDNIKGYATPPGGTPMPLRPGPSEWTPRPWQYPCGPDPCDQYRGGDHATPMSVVAGDAPPFEAHIWETSATVPVGGKFEVTASYRNKLGDEVAVFVAGPCWKPIPPITATCQSGGAVMTFPANIGMKFHGALFPTKDMTEGGAPLAPGTYKLSIDGNAFTLTVTKR